MKLRRVKKAWVISVDMGYGHQRTAYPLRDLAFGKEVINANNYPDIFKKDKEIWQSTRRLYEFISNFKKIPVLGDFVFSIFDKFQRIRTFYPRRPYFGPTISLKWIFKIIKEGWGEDLILKIREKTLLLSQKTSPKDIPLITTFFTPAFMAEEFSYPGNIFCVVCDADISRVWVSLNPKKSKIKYFVPNDWVEERLRLYGVKKENIFLTGFPLPLENIGTESMEIAKEDLRNRILNLDLKKEYRTQYDSLIKRYLGKLPSKSNHPLTIMFSVGGAGAQKEIVFEFLKSLRQRIKREQIRVILSAGTKLEIKKYFSDSCKKLGLGRNDNIKIIFNEDIKNYFCEFNKELRQTDILWTKPSELCFYSGLGIPILIAPPIGSQEEFNKRWLMRIGSGVLSEDPKYAEEWLLDYLKKGRLAEAAMEGFIEIKKLGVLNIKKICFG